MNDCWTEQSKPPMWEIKRVNEPQYVEFNKVADEKFTVLKEYIWGIEIAGKVRVHFTNGTNIYVTDTYEEVLKKLNIICS